MVHDQGQSSNQMDTNIVIIVSQVLFLRYVRDAEHDQGRFRQLWGCCLDYDDIRK